MGGGDAGDGGAADRKAAEDARQSNAIARLNGAFGIGSGRVAPKRSDFTRQTAAATTSPFSQEYSGVEQSDTRMPAEMPGALLVEEDPSAYQGAMAEYEREQMGNPSLQARKNLYQKFATDAKNLQVADLSKERDVASRDVSFDLARRGLTGGSRNIDADREIGDSFAKGLLTAENNAQGIANSAEQSDEKTRLNLISGIRGGMSDSDAVSAALNGMSNNAAQAANDARSQNIGGFFDTIRAQAQSKAETDAYQKSFEKYRAGGGGASSGGFSGNTQSYK